MSGKRTVEFWAQRATPTTTRALSYPAEPDATIGRVGFVAPGPGSLVRATVRLSPGGTVTLSSPPKRSAPTANDPIGAGAWLPTMAQTSYT